MLPIVRTFISLPAGVAEMPFWRFTAFTLLGCIPWVLGLTLIGRSVGDNWDEWQDKLHYFDYAVAALIVVGAVYLLIRLAPPPARAPTTGAGRQRRLSSIGRARRAGLGVGRAAVLGAVQGPTELLPVSSSAHLRIVPWLSAGTSTTSAPRTARPSRSPSTAAPRWRC